MLLTSCHNVVHNRPVTVTSTSEQFSAALRSMTWQDHEKAEYADYTQALLGGRLSLAGYTELVAQYYFAYVVLEEAAAHMRTDAIGSKFVFAELNRVPSLEKDLRELLGDSWREQISSNEATREYTKRLREVCFDWPGGFIAHSYTRYLGDLSGGQIIKKAVQKAFGDKGISFYDFPRIPDYNAFKTQYRALLDSVSWNDGEQQRVIAEAVLAYQLNTKVLAELGRDLAQYSA